MYIITKIIQAVMLYIMQYLVLMHRYSSYTGGETIRYALEELFPSEKVDMYASANDKKEQERLYGPNSAHSVLRKLCDTHMVW